MHTGMRKFSTVPAVFDAADGHPRIGCGNAVDENASGVQITRDIAGQRDIFGPQITAQPELAGVRRFDGGINVLDAVIAVDARYLGESWKNIPDRHYNASDGEPYPPRRSRSMARESNSI